MHALTPTNTPATPPAIPSAPTLSPLEATTAQVGIPIISKPRSYSEVGRRPPAPSSPTITYPFSLDPQHLIIGSVSLYPPSSLDSPLYRDPPQPAADDTEKKGKELKATMDSVDEEGIQFEFDEPELNSSPSSPSVLSPNRP